MFFPSLNQRYDIIMCVYLAELLSQVSDIAHGPLFDDEIPPGTPLTPGIR